MSEENAFTAPSPPLSPARNRRAFLHDLAINCSYGWRSSCPAGEVTDGGVGCYDMFGLFFFKLIVPLIVMELSQTQESRLRALANFPR